MKRVIAIVLTAVVLAAAAASDAWGSAHYRAGAAGLDISYPNCNARIPRAGFGIVGVNGGVVYTKNPCLARQASQFSDLSLYVNTGLNVNTSSGAYAWAMIGCHGNASCAAYNYGYHAARDAVAYARSQGVTSTRWWLDVEIGNTWNKDVLLNQKSIQGSYDALKASGATLVGVYSTTYQWQTITGGWKNNWPSWGATVLTSAAKASTFCKGHEFTGGPSLLMQYQDPRLRLDQNVAC